MSAHTRSAFTRFDLVFLITSAAVTLGCTMPGPVMRVNNAFTGGTCTNKVHELIRNPLFFIKEKRELKAVDILFLTLPV